MSHRLQKLGAAKNGAVLKSLTLEESAEAVRDLLEEDMVQIAETVALATRDAIMEHLADEIQTAVQPLVMRVREFAEAVEARCTQQMQLMQRDMEQLKADMIASSEELRQAIGEKVEAMDSALERQAAQLRQELAERQATGVRDLADILNSMPVPQVTVPRDAIQVNVEVTEPPQQPTTTVKEVIYDSATGRPHKIVERTE